MILFHFVRSCSHCQSPSLPCFLLFYDYQKGINFKSALSFLLHFIIFHLFFNTFVGSGQIENHRRLILTICIIDMYPCRSCITDTTHIVYAVVLWNASIRYRCMDCDCEHDATMVVCIMNSTMVFPIGPNWTDSCWANSVQSRKTQPP